MTTIETQSALIVTAVLAEFLTETNYFSKDHATLIATAMRILSGKDVTVIQNGTYYTVSVPFTILTAP